MVLKEEKKRLLTVAEADHEDTIVQIRKSKEIDEQSFSEKEMSFKEQQTRASLLLL